MLRYSHNFDKQSFIFRLNKARLQQVGNERNEFSPLSSVFLLHDSDGLLHQPLNLGLLLSVRTYVAAAHSTLAKFAYVGHKGSGRLELALFLWVETVDQHVNSRFFAHELVELLVCDVGKGYVRVNTYLGTVSKSYQLGVTPLCLSLPATLALGRASPPLLVLRPSLLGVAYRRQDGEYQCH